MRPVVVVMPVAEIIDHAAGPKLLHCFDDMAEAVHVGLRQEPAMGVHRDRSIEAGIAGSDPRGRLASARSAIQVLLAVPETDALGADPRWHYDRCNGRNVQRVYESYVQRFQRELQ